MRLQQRRGPVVAGLAILMSTGAPLGAQMQHGAKPDTMPKGMAMAGPLGIPMTREGSGTSWQPDSSPMYALHRATKSWEFMLHGNLTVQYIKERGIRGDGQFGSINWLTGWRAGSLPGAICPSAPC